MTTSLRWAPASRLRTRPWASRIRLDFHDARAGDIFITGDGRVGQGAGAFLAEGDVVEKEIKGIGRRRNRVVGGSAN
jgi:Fumarylacetoacetate (FAA) hydrolase family